MRSDAAKLADKEDATLWRWFSELYDEGRIRWCRSAQGWLVSVDHKHLATEPDFDTAIRVSRERYYSGRFKRAEGRR
ncbi:hypothetical protein [Caballeronia novacaledonica]|uniref:Uncharacterized protein n=1 Tax=Caballeronia novacaledonica TaxID=1544861 RepID=A0AA37I964_9BURK|nr:hypothetical protein [Caballeronia novacaledonica]GJH25427.1 hypothetical protein CBA19CS42_12945 [Caballeronia novacaledonica]